MGSVVKIMSIVKVNLKLKKLNNIVNLENEFTEIPLTLVCEPTIHHKVKVKIK